MFGIMFVQSVTSSLLEGIADESAIESRDVLKIGKYGRVEATLQLDADKELWRWFAITCLLLLVFEWWFYHRRTA